jgi:hypothetical protein
MRVQLSHVHRGAPPLLCIETHAVGAYFTDPRLASEILRCQPACGSFFLECRIDITRTKSTRIAVEQFSP